MKVKIPVTGGICESLQGRDKGSVYVIAHVLKDGFVSVVDGKSKRLANPKRKNVKHLRLYPVNIADYGADISADNIQDSQIAFALKNIKQAQKISEEQTGV